MRVLVVEDSVRMAQSLKKGLSEESYTVDVSHNGTDGLKRAKSGEYDLVLLDVNLPGIDGFTFVRELRGNRSDVPVLMTTARDGVQDRIEGLDCGADDYLVKPFAFEELLARMRALLRRGGSRSDQALKYADIELDPAKGRATRAGRILPLTAREFAMLKVLLANQEKVLTRAQMFQAAWNTGFDASSNVIDVYINYLRNKLEDGGGSRVIYTIRGAGYLLGKEPEYY